MHRKHILASGAALAAASLTVALAPTAFATSAGPKVTVRIEGKSRTLLAATTVQTHPGSITKDGAPTGACSATHAAGALNIASKGRWKGSWSSKYNDYFVTQILGDTEPGSKAYWGIWVNGVGASAGICGLTLHKGDQLLFAVVPATGPTFYPIAIKAPSTVKTGQRFTVKVDYYNGSGKLVPLAGAHVSGGAHGTTGPKGALTVVESHTGKLVLKIAKSATSKIGYIRDEATIHVTA